ncbi:MFS transporter [Sphingopyxis panaciterrulae]|uniref:ACS family hexuronate transporter-like MFS transporter n=1 Tax=Sphingopyxis panaciterrulae TaxID=462372 RepID=A0A7W9ESH4_9SPHN|nr:MFS transporter [Sphingopyxis panaciterrulae]MBB5708748.1 ACS family hexuronate transporter-like MFS transporter [Sphingopyxis panaciterrulae]
MALLVLNYFDRQTLAILKPVMKTQLAFDDEAYSLLTFAFMLPYIVMYVVSGRLIDRVGTRVCMTVFAIGWSVANIASGLSHSFGHLAASRVLMGAAEPGAFPVVQRAILNWVPVERRALAISIATPAGNIGAILAPPLIALLATGLNWRMAFVIPGVIGIVVAIMWWFTDTKHGSSAPPVPSVPSPVPEAVDEEAPSVKELLRDKRFLAIVAARMISDPVWYFYLFWSAGYLQERAGLSLAELGFVGGIPYIVAVLVCIMLGRLVDRYTERGHDPIRVQLRVFALSAALMPLGALITMASSAFVAVAIITVVVAVCQAWFVGYNVLLAGLFPVKINASAVGILGAVGASTSLVLNLLAGSLLAQFDYIALFAGLAILHPVSAVILFLVIGRSRARRAAATGA